MKFCVKYSFNKRIYRNIYSECWHKLFDQKLKFILIQKKVFVQRISINSYFNGTIGLIMGGGGGGGVCLFLKDIANIIKSQMIKGCSALWD